MVISSILFSDSFEVNSPDKNLKLKLTNNNGSIVYSIHKDNETIINSSNLGFMFANKPDFYQNLSLSNSSTSSFSEIWEQPWGRQRRPGRTSSATRRRGLASDTALPGAGHGLLGDCPAPKQIKRKHAVRARQTQQGHDRQLVRVHCA